MGYLFKGKIAGGYFSLPHWLYDGEKASLLSPAALSLLVFFYHALNRTGTAHFFVSERVIGDHTGLDRKTISRARNELAKAQLLRCSRKKESGAPYLYELLNPEDGKPLPSDKVAQYGANMRRQLAATPSQNAVQSDMQARGDATEGERRSKPIPLQPPAETQEKSQTPPVCKIHGDKHAFGQDGAHCGLCEDDPFAPKTTRTDDVTFSASWEEMFGTSGRTSRH